MNWPPKVVLSNFRGFSSFWGVGNGANGVFWFSLAGESRFLLISCFPSRGKADFCWFLIFPRGGKPFFADFCTSYPYESFIFLFFVDCIPYLNKFSRKLIIYSRIWVIFLENRWLYPVSEQIFPKIDNLPPYLSYFSWKSMIVSRIWADFPENW